ncbi:hypothetical protein C1J02_10035 [Sulfitobacter sp. SK011]|nr:hypothetical protein C1J02_10035 [Sulfitobacter sp. SK011]
MHVIPVKMPTIPEIIYIADKVMALLIFHQQDKFVGGVDHIRQSQKMTNCRVDVHKNCLDINQISAPPMAGQRHGNILY